MWMVVENMLIYATFIFFIAFVILPNVLKTKYDSIKINLIKSSFALLAIPFIIFARNQSIHNIKILGLLYVITLITIWVYYLYIYIANKK